MITIHAELYSTKNSKQILKKNGKPFIAKSFAAMGNQKELEQLLMIERSKWVMPEEWPVNLHLKIYRKSHRIFDYHNIFQGLLDAMTKVGYIPDDSARYIIPVYHQYEKDKDDPRVDIWLEPVTKS